MLQFFSQPHIRKYVIILMASWTVVIGASFFWNFYYGYEAMINLAKLEAQANYNKDVVYRFWASEQGGLYAPETEKTPANPYLSHIPDRDILLPSGKKLTLVNPAYMTRQVHQLGAERFGLRGHITSLKVLRPENAPDAWEKLALLSFEKGQKEFWSISKIGEQEYLRYMQPLVAQQSCLKCHAVQGYKVGEIRGGLGVSVPMAKFESVFSRGTKASSVIHILLLFLGNISIIVVGRRLDFSSKQTLESLAISRVNEEKLRYRNEEMELLNKKLNDRNVQINKVHADLVAAKDKAEESDKLKSAFLANMSHEIRTPMNGIVGFVELIAKPNVTDEKRKLYSNIISGSCQQLLHIIDDIVQIAEIETHQEKLSVGIFNLNTLLTSVYGRFSEQAEKAKLTFSHQMALPNNLAEVKIDGQKVMRVLESLIGNSLKFTHTGFVKFGYRLKGDFIEFFVEDTGIGISPEDQKVIFAPFRQVETSMTRRYGGTGLGLSIAKAYTELHGGKIWLKSTSGTGSAFYFTIPYEPRMRIDREPEFDPSSMVSLLNEKVILIAEDENSNFQYLNELFADFQVHILKAENGLEAIEKFKTSHNVDIILMDVKMPVCNGIEAMKQIKAQNSKVPIIACTAHALDGERTMLLEKGFDEYLSKPISPKVLFEKISLFL
jgi:signal transduction histidine kinase/CheY-like chemotaxis protein